MLLRKLWRTVLLYRAQFISMVIMIALGIGIFVGFNMEWVSIERNTENFFKSTGFADFRIVSEKGFSDLDLELISGIKGVKKATRYNSVTADVKEYDGDSVALTVTENPEVSGFVLIRGKAYDPRSRDGIWLSDKYADANGIRPGDRLTFVYKDMEIEGSVRGLVKSGEHMICVRDESQLMPDYDTFGFAYISPRMYDEALDFPIYPQINVISDMDKNVFSDIVDDRLGRTMMVLTKDEVTSYAEAKGEAQEGQIMGAVLPVLFLVIAVLTMVTTMHRIAAREKTQIGTLKALGFKDRRIVRHYTAYAFVIGLIGTAAGVALGYFVAWYIMNPDGTMGTYFDMTDWILYLPWFCCWILAGILILLTLIGFLSVKSMLRGTAADALRPYTPKKMRRLLIEKTGLFRLLPFGTCWNMRDIMRHKSRTAMSLIGVLGCTTIMIGTFGMQDTMDTFLKLYYDGATNYSSRIFMAEDATRVEREDAVEMYDGDWSSSNSVKIGEKAVSLDIYGIENDNVRFLNENAQFVDINDSGAYLCMRLADEFGLSKGDIFTVSPFGTDEKYELTVAGTIRSVSESIVISSRYAEKIDFPYMIDSVYTDIDKTDIESDDTIKSIQSKSMIMDSFDTFMEIMGSMIYIMILGAMVMGTVVLYNLGVMSYTERYREMATLKVLGFKDAKIGMLLISQNIWVTLAGIAAGLPLGLRVLDYLLQEMASEYEMKMAVYPKSYVVSILLTFGVSLLVSMMVAKKNKQIDMVEALKGAE